MIYTVGGREPAGNWRKKGECYGGVNMIKVYYIYV
jgi:hypothetical protein